jgi:hypothetical protein
LLLWACGAARLLAADCCRWPLLTKNTQVHKKEARLLPVDISQAEAVKKRN